VNKLQIVSTILTGFILIGITSCNLPGKASPNEQTVTVERGDLVVSISGSGNLATYQDSKLSFGSAGKIAKVWHKEGDRVKQNDILAELETDILEAAVTEAQVNVTKAEAAVIQAELALEQEPINKNKARIAVNQAKVILQTAENDLDKAQNIYKWPALEVAMADMEIARNAVKSAQTRLGTAPTADQPQWVKIVAQAEQNFLQVENKLNAMQSGADMEEVAIKKRQVENAQLSLEMAEQFLEVELQPRGAAQQSLTLAKQTLSLAQQSQKLAQKQLENATIKAPFDGVVADVKAKAGDVVDAATVVIYLVKPTLLEVVVEVDEMDIPKVAEGQQVEIKVASLPDRELTGTVASVYPVPTKITGLVMYNVKIAIPVSEDTGIKIGMRATANIIVDKKTGVIKIPSQAIKEDGRGGHFVNVIVEKKTEKSPVTIGLSDGTETEITTGLTGRETIVN